MHEAMAISEARCPALSCRVVTLLLAGAFVAFVATQAPHLVHHVFEPDLVRDECPFAASGERTGGLQIEPVAGVVTSEVSTPARPVVLLAPRSVVRHAPLGRAPPAPAA
jgi:hypothetical protein